MVPITVAIPTHNRPKFLRRALRSVLEQTFQTFELLVLDNGSTETSWRAWPELTDPRVRLVCHPTNIGLVNNENVAVSEARGAAICIFHDDDIMYPRFLESMMRALDARPSVGMVHSLVRRVDCMGNSLGVWRPARAQQEDVLTVCSARIVVWRRLPFDLWGEPSRECPVVDEVTALMGYALAA